MTQGKSFLVVLTILIIGGGLIYYFGFRNKTKDVEPKEEQSSQNQAQNQAQNQTQEINLQPGLKAQILKQGTGEGVQNGQTAVVNYTGTLENGTVFDSSLVPGRQPFSFVLGKSQVIKGWDFGVYGMRIGEKRKLTIAPELAYGERGAGNGAIPPNATLIFEVELLEIK